MLTYCCLLGEGRLPLPKVQELTESGLQWERAPGQILHSEGDSKETSQHRERTKTFPQGLPSQPLPSMLLCTPAPNLATLSVTTLTRFSAKACEICVPVASKCPATFTGYPRGAHEPAHCSACLGASSSRRNFCITLPAFFFFLLPFLHIEARRKLKA